MNNGNAEFRGLALADPVALVPQVIYGPTGYWVVYLPLATPPNQIEVYPGDTVRIRLSFQHRGASFSGYLMGALGTRPATIFNPDSALTKYLSLSVPEHGDWVTLSDKSVDIPIPASYTSYGWKGAQVKIGTQQNWSSGIKIESPDYGDAVNIKALEPYFQNMAITSFAKV